MSGKEGTVMERIAEKKRKKNRKKRQKRKQNKIENIRIQKVIQDSPDFESLRKAQKDRKDREAAAGTGLHETDPDGNNHELPHACDKHVYVRCLLCFQDGSTQDLHRKRDMTRSAKKNRKLQLSKTSSLVGITQTHANTTNKTTQN
jgi:hypothetical protein